MIMRIKSSQVAVRKSERTAKSIKAEGYLQSISQDKLQSVRQLIRNNKGIIL